MGAGLSGLICARRLAAAGATVRVLEARERVGGRLHGGRVGGAIVDLGGQWLSVGQPRIVALAAELEVATVPQRREGRLLLDEEARGLLANIATAFAQWRAARRIQRMTRTIPAGAAATAAAAPALDELSVGAW
ncbi:MAG: FAD-dependent oxidoreductase, partial [Myxococcota bacterium]|nr:FAD-dependent oxidoreductase [Myxococcota bacterium]